MKLLAQASVAVALSIALSAHAQDQRRIEAAKQFFIALQQVDGDEQMKQAVDEMLRRNPEDVQYRAEYERFFREVTATPENEEAKVWAYSETFTVDELRQITQLVQQPGYRVLAAHFVDISNANRKALKDALLPRVQAFSERIEALRRGASMQSAH